MVGVGKATGVAVMVVVAMSDAWARDLVKPDWGNGTLAAAIVHVVANVVGFVGKFPPDSHGRAGNSDQKSSLAWSGDLHPARGTLGEFPDLHHRLVAAPICNVGTFNCSRDNMWPYLVPGSPDLRSRAVGATTS